MKTALLTNLSKDSLCTCTMRVIAKLNSLDIQILMYKNMQDIFRMEKNISFCSDFNTMLLEVDFITVIGGDGTLIHAAKHASDADKPIIGINLGRVGFVSELESDEIDMLSNIAYGEYNIKKRMMLDVEVQSAGESKSYVAFNDAVLTRMYPSNMISINAKCNGNMVGNFDCDGIIVASPTGSTAYNLSAGGPIVQAEAECIIFTPICSHELISRSLILEKDSELILKASIKSQEQEFLLNIDGDISVKLQKEHQIIVKKSKQYVKLIDVASKNFFHIINKKLRKNQPEFE